MEEKEILLGNINNSVEVMRNIQYWEMEFDLGQKKLTSAKKISWFILSFFVCTLLLVILTTGSESRNMMKVWISLLPLPIYIIGRTMTISKSKARMKKASAQMEILRNDPVLFWLPPLYRHSVAYNCIASYVINMRANTLQEALNLYETERHQARVEIYSMIGASR